MSYISDAKFATPHSKSSKSKLNHILSQLPSLKGTRGEKEALLGFFTQVGK